MIQKTTSAAIFNLFSCYIIAESTCFRRNGTQTTAYGCCRRLAVGFDEALRQDGALQAQQFGFYVVQVGADVDRLLDDAPIVVVVGRHEDAVVPNNGTCCFLVRIVVMCGERDGNRATSMVGSPVVRE